MDSNLMTDSSAMFEQKQQAADTPIQAYTFTVNGQAYEAKAVPVPLAEASEADTIVKVEALPQNQKEKQKAIAEAAGKASWPEDRIARPMHTSSVGSSEALTGARREGYSAGFEACKKLLLGVAEANPTQQELISQLQEQISNLQYANKETHEAWKLLYADNEKQLEQIQKLKEQNEQLEQAYKLAANQRGKLAYDLQQLKRAIKDFAYVYGGPGA